MRDALLPSRFWVHHSPRSLRKLLLPDTISVVPRIAGAGSYLFSTAIGFNVE
ncbi:MAG: hypothetical protein M1330_00680 [Armatimonadetes bacterium]|nr:hypothetical protein [Armatimonadota bacterium]